MVARRLAAVIGTTLAFVAASAACGSGQGSRTRTAPSTPGTPTAPAPVQPGATLSGTVFSLTPEGRVPAAGVRVQIVDLEFGPYDVPFYELLTDPTGRFTQSGLVHGRQVRVTAYIDDQRALRQTCGVAPILTDDTRVDVELTGDDAPEATATPRLSGTVFEVTPQGNQPVPNVKVAYSSRGFDGLDVYTRSGADGRYSFCRLPRGRGVLYVDCRDPSSASLFVQVPVEIRDDVVANVDVTRLRASCR